MVKIGLSVEGGIIDADYQGPIKIILCNHGTEPFQFKKGNLPIVQIVLIKITIPAVQEVQDLKETQ